MPVRPLARWGGAFLALAVLAAFPVLAEDGAAEKEGAPVAAHEKDADNYRDGVQNPRTHGGAANYRGDVPDDLQARQIEANRRLAAERQERQAREAATRAQSRRDEPAPQPAQKQIGIPMPGFIYR